MREPRIDTGKLYQMLSEGKTVTKCADYFDVSKAAISKAKKKLGMVVAKEVQLENAHLFVEKHLDTVAQLRKINEYANELLDLLIAWNKGDDTALQVLESQITTKKVRIGDEERFVDEIKFKDPRELAIKTMAEIRGQLRLQNETLAMLVEMKAVHEFQQELIQLLKDIDPGVKDEFLRRLAQKQAIRRAVRLD